MPNMDKTWRLFLVLLTAWTSVSLSYAQKNCKRPRQVQRITANQLYGVWSTQMSVNFGSMYFNYTCSRIENTFGNNTVDGLSTYAVFDRRDGQYILALYEAIIVKNEILWLRLVSDPTRVTLFYFLLINKNEYVASVCLFNGGVLQQQYNVVVTRSQTTTESHAIDLLRKAGVTYTKSYFFNNSNNCYKMDGCRAG